MQPNDWYATISPIYKGEADMSQKHFYTYLIGDGRYYRTSYAISGKKALYRFIREEHGIDKVHGVVKVIHKTAEHNAPAYVVKAKLVKKEIA